MSLARDLWADLVDKRLWPVAVALALALVAIPVLLLEPAGTPRPIAAPIADAGPAHLVTDPAAIAAARPGGPVTGKVKNPFAQQHVPKPAAAPSSSSAGPGTAGPSPSPEPAASPAPSTGGGPSDSGNAGGSGGVAPRRPEPKPAADGVKRLKVRFGRTDGKRRVRTLTPGAPLPSTNNPMLVFVEVGAGNRAEFLVSSDATPEGDGRCKPSKTVCAQLFVRTGDTHFFDVTRGGEVVQYQLEVLGVVG